MPPFDEDFVKGGPVELTATQRAIEQARQASRERAAALREEQFRAATANRRARWVAGVKRTAPLIILAGVLGAGGWWLAGHPGVRTTSASRAAPAGENAPSGATVPSKTTSTTFFTLGRFDYQTGDCVTWDQTVVTDVQTTGVPCAQPHLIQVITSAFTITGYGAAYPSDAALTAYYTRRCTGPADHFLGYPLDPHGRFVATAVGPTADDWAGGDRTAWCDIQLPSISQTRLVAFTGDTRGADQELLFPIGSCGSDTAGQVPCSGLHSWQITGDVSLANQHAYPTTDAAFESLVGTSCDSLGLKFLGGAYPSGVQSSWVTLEASSWAAGERTVQCIVARFAANGDEQPFTRSLAGSGR